MTRKVQVAEHHAQAEATAMERIKEIAREEGIKIEWGGEGFFTNDPEFGRYEMSLINGGIRERFSSGNDVISARGGGVSLLIRRPKFLPHAERLANRLSREGYQVVIKKDFVVR